jgi:hypothetical protein
MGKGDGLSNDPEVAIATKKRGRVKKEMSASLDGSAHGHTKPGGGPSGQSPFIKKVDLSDEIMDDVEQYLETLDPNSYFYASQDRQDEILRKLAKIYGCTPGEAKREIEKMAREYKKSDHALQKARDYVIERYREDFASYDTAVNLFGEQETERITSLAEDLSRDRFVEEAGEANTDEESYDLWRRSKVEQFFEDFAQRDDFATILEDADLDDVVSPPDDVLDHFADRGGPSFAEFFKDKVARQ